MKKILELLEPAEKEAKRLADLNPTHSGAQVLRARILSALEFAGSPAVQGITETEAKVDPAKK